MPSLNALLCRMIHFEKHNCINAVCKHCWVETRMEFNRYIKESHAMGGFSFTTSLWDHLVWLNRLFQQRLATLPLYWSLYYAEHKLASRKHLEQCKHFTTNTAAALRYKCRIGWYSWLGANFHFTFALYNNLHTTYF